MSRTEDGPIRLFEGIRPIATAETDAPTARCVFGIVTRGIAGMPRGTVLLTLPGGKPPAGRMDRVDGVSLSVEADWFAGVLRPFWDEPGLLRVLLAGHLFSLEAFAESLVFRLSDAEYPVVQAELSALGGPPDGEGARLAYATGTVLRVVAALAAAYDRAYPQTRFPLDAAVWRAADAIESAVAQGAAIPVGSVAAQVGMGQALFARRFQDATGYSPREYIQRRRVHCGARMLLEGRATVTEIAQQLGFADAAHFCRVFKRVRGRTPNEYRQEARPAAPLADSEDEGSG